QGAYYAQSEAAAKDGARWLALPHGIVGLQFAYRKSWLEEVGQTTWPRTLDELRQVGMKLKKKGKPRGQTPGHTFGDAAAWADPERARRHPRLPRGVLARRHAVREEREARQGLPHVAPRQAAVREVVRGRRGLLGRLHEVLGATPHVGAGRPADEDLPSGGGRLAHDRLRGPAVGQGDRGLHEVHHRRHVR